MQIQITGGELNYYMHLNMRGATNEYEQTDLPPMRILILFSHPSHDSFIASILSVVTEQLKSAGHDYIVRDLYVDQFDPVLTLEEWTEYERAGVQDSKVGSYVSDLSWCQGILLIFPTWWYGMPAILKGYFDRVWLPGIAFGFTEDRMIETSQLEHITRFAVVTTYGSPWWWIKIWLRDPVRMAVQKGLRRLFNPRCRVKWFAFYNMDRSSLSARLKFIQRVTKGMNVFDS
jgi:putative NADPH-quinone reductase